MAVPNSCRPASSSAQWSRTSVGLPDAAVEEPTERVQAAVRNCGLSYLRGRLALNPSAFAADIADIRG